METTDRIENNSEELLDVALNVEVSLVTTEEASDNKYYLITKETDDNGYLSTFDDIAFIDNAGELAPPPVIFADKVLAKEDAMHNGSKKMKENDEEFKVIKKSYDEIKLEPTASSDTEDKCSQKSLHVQLMRICPEESLHVGEKWNTLAPFSYGFKRELVHRKNSEKKLSDVYYFAPDGKKLRSYKDVEKYLPTQESFHLEVKNFCFKKTVISENNVLEGQREAREPEKKKGETPTIITIPNINLPNMPKEKDLSAPHVLETEKETADFGRKRKESASNQHSDSHLSTESVKHKANGYVITGSRKIKIGKNVPGKPYVHPLGLAMHRFVQQRKAKKSMKNHSS